VYTKAAVFQATIL